MKRILAAAVLAIVAGVSAADQYNFNAGERDPATPIADVSDTRFNAGEADPFPPVASAGDAYRSNAGDSDSGKVVQIQLG